MCKSIRTDYFHILMKPYVGISDYVQAPYVGISNYVQVYLLSGGV